MPDPSNIGEIVPLTGQDMADLTEVHQRQYGRESSQRTETTDRDLVRSAQAYYSTLRRILLTHGFDPNSAGITLGTPLVMRANRTK